MDMGIGAEYVVSSNGWKRRSTSFTFASSCQSTEVTHFVLIAVVVVSDRKHETLRWVSEHYIPYVRFQLKMPRSFLIPSSCRPNKPRSLKGFFLRFDVV